MTDVDRQHEDDMDAGISALQESSDRLVRVVEELSIKLNTTERMQQELGTQQEEIKAQAKRLTTQKTINRALALSLLFDIVLSIAVCLGYLQIDRNADSIGNIQNRTSSEVLCPLYGLLVDQIANTDPEDIPEDEKEDFAKQVAVITRGYEALDCQAGP